MNYEDRRFWREELNDIAKEIRSIKESAKSIEIGFQIYLPLIAGGLFCIALILAYK